MRDSLTYVAETGTRAKDDPTIPASTACLLPQLSAYTLGAFTHMLWELGAGGETCGHPLRIRTNSLLNVLMGRQIVLRNPVPRAILPPYERTMRRCCRARWTETQHEVSMGTDGNGGERVGAGCAGWSGSERDSNPGDQDSDGDAAGSRPTSGSQGTARRHGDE